MDLEKIQNRMKFKEDSPVPVARRATQVGGGTFFHYTSEWLPISVPGGKPFLTCVYAHRRVVHQILLEGDIY